MAISWDEYFMSVAFLSAMRSKDPNTQVGACIVDDNKLIVGVGYNGTPRGWDDKEFPWARDGEPLQQKYPYVIHAELNAILNATTRDLRGCTMYVTEFSCNECAKAMAQAGIKRMVYAGDKYAHTDAVKAAKRIFDKLNIKHERFKPARESLTIRLKDNPLV
jgi:dCMP deaminase